LTNQQKDLTQKKKDRENPSIPAKKKFINCRKQASTYENVMLRWKRAIYDNNNN